MADISRLGNEYVVDGVEDRGLGYGLNMHDQHYVEVTKHFSILARN